MRQCGRSPLGTASLLLAGTFLWAAGLALAFGRTSYLSALALVLGISAIAAGSYRWHMASVRVGPRSDAVYWWFARWRFCLLVAVTLALLSFAIGPWDYSPPLRIFDALAAAGVLSFALTLLARDIAETD